MEVVVPQFVGDDGFGDDTLAELLGSSIAASAESTWVVGTTYAVDNVVKYQITEGVEKGIWKEFKSLQSANTGNNPYSSPTWWSDQGATERWKMFDYLNLTVTTESTPATDIVVNLHCKRITSINFLNIQAKSITIKVYKGSEIADKIAGNLIETIVIDLTQELNDWFEYFFDDFDYIRDVSSTIAISMYYNTVLEITFEKLSGEDCYVGQCIPGRNYYLGSTQYGINTGIKDYSKKSTDDVYGYTYLAQGNYKKLIDVDVNVQNEDLNTINSILTQLRGIPTVWQANESDLQYDNLLTYGFYKNFTVIMNYPSFSKCSIEIEGLI